MASIFQSPRKPLFDRVFMTEPGAIQGLVKDTIDRLRNVDRLIHSKAQTARTSDSGNQEESLSMKKKTSQEQLTHDKENVTVFVQNEICQNKRNAKTAQPSTSQKTPSCPRGSEVDIIKNTKVRKMRLSADEVCIIPFTDEKTDLKPMMKVVGAELSEPYSIYTYRYFIQNWPDLSFLAKVKTTGEVIGVIVCKDEVLGVPTHLYRKGYIAMLAVNVEWRKLGLGSKLVLRAIEELRKRRCNEVLLETESTNGGSLSLYERLGFCRDDRMHRYYLNSEDAFRLRYFIDEYHEMPEETLPELEMDDCPDTDFCDDCHS